MSWDVMLIKTITNAEPMEEINENNIVPFSLADVTSKLKNQFPNATEGAANLLNYEGGTFAIAFNLATNRDIMLHVHILEDPEDAVMDVINKLCTLFNCRAFDTTSAEFLEI